MLIMFDLDANVNSFFEKIFSIIHKVLCFGLNDDFSCFTVIFLQFALDALHITFVHFSFY